MSETLQDNKELLERVAAHLAGRPVEVRFREPRTQGAAGCAMKNAAGTGGIIDISPAETPREQWRIYLHELAHIRQDWAALPGGPTASLPPASVAMTKAEHEIDYDRPHEARARDLGYEWAKFADFHFYGSGRSTMGELAGRLAALLLWRE